MELPKNEGREFMSESDNIPVKKLIDTINRYQGYLVDITYLATRD